VFGTGVVLREAKEDSKCKHGHYLLAGGVTSSTPLLSLTQAEDTRNTPDSHGEGKPFNVYRSHK